MVGQLDMQHDCMYISEHFEFSNTEYWLLSFFQENFPQSQQRAMLIKIMVSEKLSILLIGGVSLALFF